MSLKANKAIKTGKRVLFLRHLSDAARVAAALQVSPGGPRTRRRERPESQPRQTKS